MSGAPITAEDLYLYSMHLLEPEENQRLEDFLQRSSDARGELLKVRGDLSFLALAVEPQPVPDMARHRLMNQIAREPKTAKETASQFLLDQQGSVPPAAAVPVEADRYTPSAAEAPRLGQIYDEAPRRGFFAHMLPWAGWAVAAGLGFTAWTYYQRTQAMGSQVADAQASASRAVETSARAQTVLETLRSTSSQRFLLTAAGTPPAPSARVSYLAESGSLVFQGSDLDAVPTDKTYELWLIPAEKDAKPIPAGTFTPDSRGYASLIMPALPRGITAGTFGITLEDTGGSQTPTLPILLVGTKA